MFVQSLDLENFRNYERIHLDFSTGIHIFYGDNAQGKTNLLEAVSLSLTSRSLRGAKDREMIAFDAEEAHIKAIIEKNEYEYRIDLHLKQNKNKGIAVNQVPVRKTGEFIGRFPLVFFSPEDLQIVKEGPQERRKFIDTELCQLDKIYMDAYLKYKKVLEQRNQLLKDIAFRPSLLDTLDVWDTQLVSYGKQLIRIRASFIEQLSAVTGEVHRSLTGGKEKLQLFYEPDTEEDAFEENLRRSREKDLKNRTTHVGPHRDDLRFDLNGIDARIYGSQGQQRTCALSLKMAEIELVKNKMGDQPVLLLDDVLSELDSGRQHFLLDSIHGVQTFITCTGLEDFVNNRFQTDHVFYVSHGSVEEVKNIGLTAGQEENNGRRNKESE